MKLVLTIFGLALVLTFGAITAVQSYTPASAGDDATTCRDDGDDEAESPDLPDNPDNEDNTEELGAGAVQAQGDEPEEVGDPQDDPPNEWDDLCHDEPEPTGVLGESATPCPLSAGIDAVQLDCCPGGGSVDAELLDPCDCQFAVGGEVGVEGPCLCPPSDGGDVDAQVECCASSGPPHASICSVAGDADCDGEVTAADAYATLAQLGGVSAASDGCASGGDADCSGAVDALDTLAILKVLAGVTESAAC